MDRDMNTGAGGLGYLTVRVSTASGAIPIEGAVVIVRGYGTGDGEIFHSLTTDRSGLTARISLPAPPSSLSKAPNPPSTPYAPYSIDVYREGYYPQYYANVPIFDGITAIQDARIIPISELTPSDPYLRGEQVFGSREVG